MSESSRIGFGSRLGAAIIDAILAIVLGMGLGAVGGAALGGMMGAGDGGGDLGMGLGAIGGFLAGAMVGMPLVYVVFILMEAFMGQTPGKMILGIKIKNQDGSNAGTGTLLIRALLKNINWVMTILFALTSVAILATLGQYMGFAIFIGCFFVLGAKKQGFHDMIGKTAVFKK